MDQQTIRNLLFHQGFEDLKIAHASMLTERALKHGFLCSTLFAGVNTQLLIGFKELFPLSLPQYYILNYENYSFIPHVENDGRICYMQDDYLFIDADRPGDIISETFDKAKNTVEAGLRKENLMDFTREFEAYWHRLKKAEEASFNGILDANVTEIKVGVNDKMRFIVSNDTLHLQSADRFFNLKEGGFTFQNGIYISLNPENVIIPPRYGTPISLDYIKALILNNVTVSDRQKIERLASRSVKKEEYVIFSILQSDGSSSLFGVKFIGMDKTIHPLLSENQTGKIVPIRLLRLDKDYLFNRGSNGVKHKKNGLLIGGGSIGGFIADDLVRSGFFDLTIVDADDITPENCYRHLIGFSSIGQNKAKALKKHLENKFPHCYIKAEPESIETLLAHRKIKLADYDYIIVATGNVTINIYLAQAVKKIDINIPILFSWNDPYGIGGHCLLTDSQKMGCYECLYTNDTKTNLASFAAPLQKKTFLKNVSGCGSFFTPYGSLDSMQTSQLTVRKLVDLLSNSSSENAIYSWKGKPNVFLNEGYKLSPRFHMTDVELEQSAHQFINPYCKTCNPKTN